METTLLEMPRTPKDKPLASLRERREDKHWSISTVAKLSGVDHATIWRIENGKTVPHRSTMKAIAAALDLPLKAIAEFVEPGD